MQFYKFNYCPNRFMHLIGGYKPGMACPQCGYGGEVDFVAYDDVNMNVPPYGSLPSDRTDISPHGLVHDHEGFYGPEVDHQIKEWKKLGDEDIGL